MHSELIECLRSYKVNCEFRCTDFDVDKAARYEWLRKEMAKKYEENHFGPVALSQRTTEFVDDKDKKHDEKQIKEDKHCISRGYNKILEKVKHIRQGGFESEYYVVWL